MERIKILKNSTLNRHLGGRIRMLKEIQNLIQILILKKLVESINERNARNCSLFF